jgi:predicted MFS family arabinose efflux permease
VTAPDRGLVRARVATATIFLIIGTVFGDWVSRVPSIEDQTHAGSGPFGAALLGIAVGAVLARPWCSRLVTRFGSKSVTRGATVGCCLALILPSLADNALVLGLALTAFGAMLGSVDIAMNAHAVAVERQYDRPIMSTFHAVYSIGGLLGVLVGGRAAAWGLSPRLHFTLVAAALSAVALVASSYLLSSSSEAVTYEVRSVGRAARLPRELRLPLVLLGVVGLCSMAGEGAVGDWGAIYLHDNLKSSLAVASWGFAAYSLAMVVGRLFGHRLMARWGDWWFVTCSTVVAGLGFAAALLVGRPAAAICGFVVLGLGLCLIVPVTMSKAGHLGGDTPAPAVALVSSISGLGPIATPPLIGFVAQGIGLPAALGTVSVLAFAAAGLIQVVKYLTKPATAASPLIIAAEN